LFKIYSAYAVDKFPELEMYYCILQRATEEGLSPICKPVSTKPDVPLDKPVHFLYEVAEVSNFAGWIACFMFPSEFDDRTSLIESKLNNLKSICQVTFSLLTNSLGNNVQIYGTGY
jgi:hypothetical protein